MGDKSNPYDIVLPKGEAAKPYYEMNEEERNEVSRKVFEKVKERAERAGVIPVTTETLKTHQNDSSL